MGLNRGFTSHTVVNIVLSVKVGWTKCSLNNLLCGTIILFHWPITDFQFLRSLDSTMLLVFLRHRKRHNQITEKINYTGRNIRLYLNVIPFVKVEATHYSSFHRSTFYPNSTFS